MKKGFLCQLIVICMLLSLVPYGYAQPEIELASVELGAENIENGLQLIENPSSYLSGTETRASYGIKDGVPCKIIGNTTNSMNSFAYFKLTEEARKKISGNIYLMLDFYDYAPVRFWIEYCGADGAYTKSEEYTSQGSSNWVQTVFKLDNVNFNGGQHYGSDFRLVIKYGMNYSLPIKSVALCSTLSGNTKYTPFINVAMKNVSGGIDADFSDVIFEGETTIPLKGEPLTADITSAWGSGDRNLMAIVKYYDGDSSFSLEYLKNGAWTETESIGGFGTGRFEKKVVSLSGITLTDGAPELKLKRKSGTDTVYISGFMVREYDEKAETENGTASYEAESAVLMDIKTDANKEVVQSGGKKYISYSGNGDSFELGLNIDAEYINEDARDLYIELQYGANTNAEVWSEYVNAKDENVVGGTVSLKGDGEDKIQTFVLKDAVCKKAFDGNDLKFTVNGSKLDLRVIRVYKVSPFSKDSLFDSFADLNNNGKIVTAQNTHSWQFMKYTEGEGYKQLTLDNAIPSWKDGANLPGIYMHGNERFVQQPSAASDFVLAWTPSKTGTATIFSRPHMSNSQTGSDGIKADIVYNGRTISTKTISGTDVVGEEEILSLEVKKGEPVYFRINKNGGTSYDFADWRPIILINEKKTSGNTSKEASISLGTVSAGEGIKVKNEYSSIKLTSGNAVLTNDYSETPCIALKMDDGFRYKDAEVNPVYVEATIQNKDGSLIWCEYHGADGSIKKTATVGTTGTSTGRNVSFMLENADFGSELPWHFKICSKQQEGVIITKIKTTQVMPKSYILTLDAESDTYNGLKLAHSASKGVSTTEAANKNVYCLSGKDAAAYIDADNTYAYLNGQSKAYLMIEYFDNICEFGIEYVNSAGKKVTTETVRGTNSLTRKNAVLVLENPVFKNSEAGGSDFKIFATERDKVNISKISLSSETFPEYYIGVDRGGEEDASGITIITGNKVIEKDGKKAVEVTKEGVGYDIDDKAFGKLSADGTIYNITVEYLDVPNVEFMLTYDSSKIKIFDAHNAETWHIKTCGSGEWKTANFPVTNAYFANGQPNKADFTVIKANGDEALYVSDVSVRKGYGEMYDIATEKSIPIVSSAIYNADRIDNANFDLKSRLLDPFYAKYGNDKFIDGTCRYGVDFIELYMPTLAEQTVCGVVIPSGYDDYFKVEVKSGGEWKMMLDGLYARNMQAGYKVVTFEPIKASAVRVTGICKDGYGGIGSRFAVYSPTPDNAEYHSGSLNVSTEKEAYENEDISFNIAYTGNDAGSENYTIKADIVNNAEEIVKKDTFVETVPANGAKNLIFTLSKTDPLYAAGAYTLDVRVYKDGILLDRDTHLYGIKGTTKPVDLSAKQLPLGKRTLSLGAIGQFNYVTGKVIPKDVFEDLRDSGYDTIQIEIYLREIEPIKGVYDFTVLDKNVENAMDAGLSISIWLEFQDTMTPDWIPENERMCDQFGQTASARRPDIDGHFGTAVWPSPWGETFLAETEQCVKKIAERYDSLTNVVSYGIGSLNCEVFYPDDYETYDYSEPAQKAFREKYLQGELGLTLEEVSERYGRNYSSWDEVRLQVPERDANGDYSATAYSDFEEFRKFTQTQFFKRNMKLFNEAAPAKPISMFGSISERYDEEIYNLAKRNGSTLITQASNEYTRVVPKLNFAGTVLNGWIHGEPGYIPATSGAEGNAGRAFFHTAEAGKATMNWQATPMESGKDRAAIIGYEKTYKAVEQIKDLFRIGEDVLNCNIVENDIAIIAGSVLQDGEQGVLGNSRWGPNAYTIDITTDGVRGAIQSFVQNGTTISAVDYYQDYAYEIFCTPEILKDYKLVIQDNQPVLKSEIVDTMATYVKDGGTLLLFSNSGMCDPTNTKPWELLSKLSGGKAIPGGEITAETREFRAANSPIFAADTVLRIKNYRDISGWDWAQTVAEVDGIPMVKMWQYGSGRVIYCAGEIYPGDNGSLGNGFIQSVCDYVGIEPQAENSKPTFDAGSTYSIYKRVKQYGNDRYLMLFANNWSGNSYTKVKLNSVEPNTNYRVYYAHRDYDEFLQRSSGGDFLAKDISLPPAATSILKYTTDRLFSAVGDFNRQEAASWSYYRGDKKITAFDDEAKAFKDGGVVFKEKTTIPAEVCSRVWTAPESGFVSIKGYAALVSDGGNVSGRVLLNGKEIDSFTLTGKNRHRLYLAEKVNAGDEISFVLENKGDISLAETDWNPQLALNTKAQEIKLDSGLSGSGNERTWTASKKGRVVIAGSASGNAVARILNGADGIYGQTISGTRAFYIDTEVKPGQTIHFVSEDGEPLSWSGSLWILE